MKIIFTGRGKNMDEAFEDLDSQIPDKFYEKSNGTVLVKRESSDDNDEYVITFVVGERAANA